VRQSSTVPKRFRLSWDDETHAFASIQAASEAGVSSWHILTLDIIQQIRLNLKPDLG